MLRPLSNHYLTALLAAQLAATGALCAFEQGSYYIFDLVESDATKPNMGRLAIPAQAITTEAPELRCRGVLRRPRSGPVAGRTGADAR